MYNITAPEFSKLSHITHSFFTRNVPGNSNIYINKTDNNKLKPEIDHNKRIIASILNQSANNLCILKQVHSNKAIIVIQPWDTGLEPEADAMVTSNTNIILAIMTADCCPLLFADRNQNIIAAAHVGWRGARNSVIDNTINTMLNLGAKLKDIHVVIGPCIHQESYEVGPEFYKNFINESITNSNFFINSTKPNHFKFNLLGYVTNKLQLLGISIISNINRNTFAEEENFLSYRRYTLNQNPDDEGSLLSLIALK
ncbi:MAG: peptidoglycan editing factor PgeF [Rickettsiales endosymbiont of Dermacentor nuttalli]